MNGSDRVEQILESGVFSWRASPPLIGPVDRPEDPCVSIKDPSVVFHNGRYHIFASIRSEIRTHQTEYLSFAAWEEADAAERHILTATDGFFCAPQVFFFEPHDRWYLISQIIDESRQPALQPAFSTSKDLADPLSWTAPELMFGKQPENVEMWLDFWVICDEESAHLFFTSLNGKLWHARTPLDGFPHGWESPSVVLEADVYEASHTYKLSGQERYLTVIEAVAPDGRRYFKAYTATSLAGSWEPLADTLEKPLAGVVNVAFEGEPWSTSFSHGEFVRSGVDQRLEIDLADTKLLFQGVPDEERDGIPYGKIPWRLGLLELVGE
jgi:hypothetical protein